MMPNQTMPAYNYVYDRPRRQHAVRRKQEDIGMILGDVDHRSVRGLSKGPPLHQVRARAFVFLFSCLGAVVARNPRKCKQEISEFP